MLHILKSLAFAVFGALIVGGTFDLINAVVRVWLDKENFVSAICLWNGPAGDCQRFYVIYGLMFIVFFLVRLVRVGR